MECKICDRKCHNFLSLCRHLSLSHFSNAIEYYVKFEDFKIPKCRWCDNNSKHRKGLIFGKTCSSKKCLSKEIQNRIISDETRKKISMSKMGNNGWYHINSQKDRRSYPEKVFFNLFKKYDLFEKYQIEEKLSIGKYFLDFAFVSIKLDVEIDGAQHYSSETAINHDKIRDDFMRCKGWKIYRICWSSFCKNAIEEIQKFMRYLDNIQNETDCYYSLEDVINAKYKPKYGKQEDYFRMKKIEWNNAQEKYVQRIMESDIDFTKFGWVNKVAIILNQKPQKVNIWMKRMMPEFYQKCFQRSAN